MSEHRSTVEASRAGAARLDGDDRARVLLCAYEYGHLHVGGLGTMLTALGRGLEQHEVVRPIVAMPGSGVRPPWTFIGRVETPRCHVDRYLDGGTEVWMLRNDVLDRPGIYPEDAIVDGMAKADDYGDRLAEVLAVMPVDIVHLHDAYGYRCLPSCRRLSLPSVYSLHRRHLDEPPFALVEEIAVEQADEVTTVSASYAREEHEFFGARERVHVLPNGIDHGFWRATSDHSNTRADRRRRLLASMGLPDRPTFAYLGRLDLDQKGVDVLIDGWERYCADIPANLLFHGTGDPVLVDRVRACARSDGQRVRFFHEHHSQVRVRDLFSAVDCVIVPSRYEPFGLVQVEAMAMEALVIGARTGGLADVLVDASEPDGFARLFEVGDAHGLANVIRATADTIAAGGESLERYRQLGLARSHEYSSSAMTEGYVRLYRHLLGDERLISRTRRPP